MRAFQDSIPHNNCWGCGTLNPKGLHLKSFWEGEESVCNLQPRPEFMAGPTDVLYGGFIAAVFDCHCVCTAVADSYRAAGREIGSEPHLWSVTAHLAVDYLAPTPLSRPIQLRARIRDVKGRKRTIDCVLLSGGVVCARAEVLAVEVPASTWAKPSPP